MSEITSNASLNSKTQYEAQSHGKFSLTLDQLNKVSDIAQKLAVIIGLIIGGWWGLYTFHEQLLAEKAKTELETSLLQLDANKQMSLDADLDISQFSIPEISHNYLLSITATIKNNSFLPLTLETDEILLVEEVTINEDGEVRFSASSTPMTASMSFLSELGLRKLEVVSLPPGGSAKIPFVVGVKEPGLYLVQLEASLANEEQEATILQALKQQGIDVNFGSFIAQKFVVVQ